MSYHRRYLHDFLAKRPTNFRAILITGPRRSGKSTLCKEILKDWGGKSYVTFDTPLEQARFANDPLGYLRALATPVVLDEVQNVPEIFNYLKVIIDENPESACDYILTGSQQFQMMNKVSESLAGRILIKELYPFSLGEMRESSAKKIQFNFETILALKDNFSLGESLLNKEQVLKYVSSGGFPPAALNSIEEQRNEWFNSYVETYIQRDLRSLSNVQNLSSFSRFISLIAGRTAQIINASELGKDIGVNYKTAQHYLSLLETSYLWKSLPPYYKVGSEKRLSKSPKGIFLDTGLAMFLIGLSLSGIERNPLCGAMFESLVIGEFLKLAACFGKRVALCHFRAGESAEVDLVIEHGSQIIPIEIKCSASIDSSWGKGIKVLKNIAKIPTGNISYVISLNPQIIPLGEGIVNVPISCFI